MFAKKRVADEMPGAKLWPSLNKHGKQLQRFVMVLSPQEGWRSVVLPPQPVRLSRTRRDENLAEIYKGEMARILHGPMLSLNTSVAPAMRRALSGLHLLINEEGMPRGLEPTAAMDVSGNGKPRIICGPVVASRGRKGPTKDCGSPPCNRAMRAFSRSSAGFGRLS